MDLFAVAPLRSRGWLRWTASMLGLLIAVLVSAMVIGETITEPPSLTSPDLVEGIFVGVVAIWLVASLLLAWRWEKLGGLSCVLVGVALGIGVAVTAESNNIPAALTLGLPLIVIGAAFLFADRQSPVSRQVGGG